MYLLRGGFKKRIAKRGHYAALLAVNIVTLWQALSCIKGSSVSTSCSGKRVKFNIYNNISG